MTPDCTSSEGMAIIGVWRKVRFGPVRTKGIPLESERTANPVQTTAFFGMEKGFRRDGVDGWNPDYFLSQGRYIPTRF